MFLKNTVTALAQWSRKDIILGRGLAKTEMEAQLLSIFRESLNCNEIQVEDNLFDLGLDSLKFLSIFSQIEEQFSINIDFQEFVENPSICQIENYSFWSN